MRNIALYSVYGREAVRHKLKNCQKTQKIHFHVYANEIDLLTQSHAIGFQLPVIVNTRNFPTYGTNLPLLPFL